MSLFVNPITRALDANGVTLPGATLTFYLTGTTTLSPVYTSSARTVEHTNPVVADAGGLFAPIYLNPELSYRAILKNAAGTVVQDIDPCSGVSGSGFVGTFAEAQTTSFAASIDTIRVTDRDGAIYVRVASEPTHAGKLRTTDRFLPNETSDATNGGWWELARWQYVTPDMIGAVRWEPPTDFNIADNRNHVAGGIVDSTAALNSIRGLIDANYHKFDLDGVYGASSLVTIGASNIITTDGQVSIIGNLYVMAMASYNTIVNMNNVGNFIWSGTIFAGGGDADTWATRTNWHGIVFSGWNSGFQIDLIGGFGVKGHGVILDGSGGGFAHFMRIGKPVAYQCGSGLTEGNPVNPTYFSAGYSGRVDGGSANSPGQYTRYTLDAVPPMEFSDYGESASDPLCWVTLNGKIYKVQAFDRTLNTIDLYPWVDSAAPPTGTMYFVYGAGLTELYGDAGNGTFNNADISYCGIAYQGTSLYPSHINKLTAQSNCAGVIYRGPGNAQVGGHIGTLYAETNMFDVALFNGSNNESEIGFIGPTSYSKIVAPHRHGGGTGEDMHATSDGLGRFKIHNLSGWEPSNKRHVNNDPYISLDAGFRDVWAYHGDNLTLNLIPPDAELHRLFGGLRTMIVVTGSGSKGEPTGTITFTGFNGGTVQIEGGAAAASVGVSGMKQPLVVMVEGTTAGAMTIRYVTRPASAAIASPTGGTTIDAEARAAIDALRAAVAAHGITA